VRNKSVWERACGLSRTIVEGVDFDEHASSVVVSVRPAARARDRCGRCGRRSPRYDLGEGRRRWRALDLGTTKVFLEANAPRVRCRTHGVTVAAVPWARHSAGHTRDFDDLAAWLAVRTSKSAVTQLLRVAWRTVGSIVTRVNADVDATIDRLDGLRRIGIDEISYKRGHRYLIVVVDHDSGRLVWAGPGRNDAALHVFFDELGPERAALLTHVSADMADWIARVVARRAPNALRSADPFHVIAKTDPRLWRAYLLKEGLRYVFAVKGEEGKQALDRWSSWARRSRMPAFVQLQQRIAAHREAIDAALETGLSQGLVESTNTKIRLLTRIAFGFHGYQPLIALAMLSLGSHPPRLPGRD
jgi:transposase